jgi:hypothetical protein
MGLGGDELFDGDPRCLALRALSGDVLGAVREASTIRVPWEASRIGRVRDFVLRPIAVHATPRRVRWLARRRRRRLSWAGPVMQRVLDRPAPEPERENDFGPRTPEQFFRALSDSTYALEISDARAQVAYETGCATIEPYRDERLVAFVARLPPAALLHGGYMRGLFRHAFRGLVPDAVRLRTDKASFEPALDAMHRPIGGRGAFSALASMRALEDLGVVRAKEYKDAFDAFLRKDDPGSDWIAVWPALSVEAFAEKALGLP